MDTSLAIKLFSLIPGLKEWAIRRFSKIEFTPINSQGNNIFHRKTDTNEFFVKLYFNLKAHTDIDILDISIVYGKGFSVIKRIIEFDNAKINTDGSFRMNEYKRLESGQICKVFLSTTFRSTGSEKDYDNVKIEFDISAPVLPGTRTKTLIFDLSSGGAIKPEKTQSFGIF